MKITKKMLERIIKEEIERLTREVKAGGRRKSLSAQGLQDAELGGMLVKFTSAPTMDALWPGAAAGVHRQSNFKTPGWPEPGQAKNDAWEFLEVGGKQLANRTTSRGLTRFEALYQVDEIVSEKRLYVVNYDVKRVSGPAS